LIQIRAFENQSIIPLKPEDQGLSHPAPPINYHERVLLTGSDLKEVRNAFKNNPTFDYYQERPDKPPVQITLEKISSLLSKDLLEIIPDKNFQRWADQEKAKVHEVLQSQGMKAAQKTAIKDINEATLMSAWPIKSAVVKIAFLKYMSLGWESAPKTTYFTVEASGPRRGDPGSVRNLGDVSIDTNVIVQTQDGWKFLQDRTRFSDLEVSKYDGTFVTGNSTFVYLINSTGIHEPEEYWVHKPEPSPPEPVKPSLPNNPPPDNQGGWLRGLDGKWYERQ
jgi:hypothetical protein